MPPPDVRKIVKKKMFLHQKKKKLAFLKIKNDFINKENCFNRIQIDNTMNVFFRFLVIHKLRFINLIDFFKKFTFTIQSTDCVKSIFNFSKEIDFYFFKNNFETTGHSYGEIRFLNSEDPLISQKNKKKKLKNMFVIPNQTSFLKLISRTILKQRLQIKLRTPMSAFFYKKSIWKMIKYGKIIKPSDYRSSMILGEEDFFSIKGFSDKKGIFFSKENENCEFFFCTPLSLKKDLTTCRKNFLFEVRFISFDFVEIISMQNFENLFFIVNLLLIECCRNYKNLNKIDKTILIKARYFDERLFTFFKNINIEPLITSNNFNNKRNFEKKTIENIFIFKSSQSLSNLYQKKKNEIFKKVILQHLEIGRYKSNTMIFVKTYYEFIVIRNMLIKIYRNHETDIITLHEFKKISKVRKIFLGMKRYSNKIILVTERFYFHNRISFRCISKIFFYSLPVNTEFIFEIIRGPALDNKKIFLYVFTEECEFRNFF